jgi:anti-sigma regulatory factor (Ser/Thr protein kinase)
VGPHGTLLGVAHDPFLTDTAVELRPGDSLVLYTDGLTDAYAPEEILTQADLVAALERCQGREAGEITRGVANALLGVNGRQPRDDIALLVLRIPPAELTPLAEVVVRLEGDADAVPVARQSVQQLRAELGEELLTNVGLLVSELVTNSIRHTEASPSATIELQARVFADRVRVDVRDHGPVRDRSGLAPAAPPALLDLRDAQPDQERDHRHEVGNPGQPMAGVGVVHLAAV